MKLFSKAFLLLSPKRRKTMRTAIKALWNEPTAMDHRSLGWRGAAERMVDVYQFADEHDVPSDFVSRHISCIVERNLQIYPVPQPVPPRQPEILKKPKK